MYVDSEAQLYYFPNFNSKQGTVTGNFLVTKGPSGNKTVTEILTTDLAPSGQKHAFHHENMMVSK
jgi:hypothetical protein